MDVEKYSSGACPVARALVRVGDAWSIMILRDAAAFGRTRFDEFQKSLGIAPNILTRRLTGLVEAGLLERRRYNERPPRDEYILTQGGRDYLPVLDAMAAWGDRNFPGDDTDGPQGESWGAARARDAQGGAALPVAAGDAPVVSFWFDLASSYSYLTAMRIEGEAAKRGVTVRWRPFLLGPIFSEQGLNDSPFNVYPAKGRYMWRDIARRAERLGLPFHVPEEGDPAFPQASLLAVRAALVAMEEGAGPAFCKAVFAAQFADGRDIADRALIGGLGALCGVVDIVERAGSPEIRAQLWDIVSEAKAAGVFGAPTFMVGDELFWGDDRLEEALDWAAAKVLSAA